MTEKSDVIYELIGEVYDCAIDPSRWQQTLKNINAVCRLSGAMLALQAAPSGEYLLSTFVGYETTWLERLPGYVGDMVTLWGGLDQIFGYPLDEPVVHSWVKGLPDARQTQYYKEWLRPQGIIDAIVVPIARNEESLGSIAFSRHESAGAIEKSEVELLRILGPHFRRAITISRMLDLKALGTTAAHAMLDQMSAAVIFVDQNLNVIASNAAAESMLAQGDPVQSVRGKLAVKVPNQLRALEAMVKQAADNGPLLAHRGIGVPITSKGGDNCILHVLPLNGGELRPVLNRKAQVALFISQVGATAITPRDAIAQIFDLTNAESRVFEQVASGKTPAEIAKQFGVAPSTVKSHLLKVFDKTGCKRQSDIVRLARSMSLQI